MMTDHKFIQAGMLDKGNRSFLDGERSHWVSFSFGVNFKISVRIQLNECLNGNFISVLLNHLQAGIRSILERVWLNVLLSPMPRPKEADALCQLQYLQHMHLLHLEYLQ